MRSLFIALTLLVTLWSSAANATPALARKQQLACTVCHTAFPELNATGRQFKEEGYRFPGGTAPNAPVKTAGMDVGLGIILDNAPGIALRVVSGAFTMQPDGKGSESVSSTPIDSAELVMAGSNGDHWSYMAEMGAEQEGDYAVEGNAVLMYRANRSLTVFTGWTPMFSRDAYNSLSESRRIDHVDHAIDYTGSTGIEMNTEGGVFGAYGRLGPLFYLAEVGPGPDAPIAEDEPLDYVGRLAFNINKNVAVGGFVYYGATADASTVRPGVDFNAVTPGAGTFKVAGMYDTTDSAVLGEVGWDYASQMKGFWVIPMAHLDLQSVGGATQVVPMVGVGVQQSAGRVQLEVSDALGGSGAPLPKAQLVVDVVF